MTNKLDIIMKTAEMLLADYPSGWSGDIHAFATASAGVSPDEALWLTSHDVKDFHTHLNLGAMVSDYAWISASLDDGEPLLIVQDVGTGKV